MPSGEDALSGARIRLYRGQNDFDFPKVWRTTTVVSVSLVLVIDRASLFVRA